MLRLYADPVFREKRAASSRAVTARLMEDPEHVEMMRAVGRKHGPANIERTRSKESRRKAGASISAIKLAHIPAAYRELYRDLKRSGLSAGERERLVLEQQRQDREAGPRMVRDAARAMREKHRREVESRY